MLPASTSLARHFALAFRAPPSFVSPSAENCRHLVTPSLTVPPSTCTGKTQASQLQFAEGGMHRPQQFALPATHAHAGKITASSLMPGEFGISGSAKPYARNPSSGVWSTSYDNAYRP